MKSFAQLCPKWSRRLKKNKLTKEELDLILDRQYCVVGEAHKYDKYYQGCKICNTFCVMIGLFIFDRNAIARINTKKVLAEIEKFVKHFNQEHIKKK